MQQHDFKQFPELTNSQMQIYYFESPHKQIVEPFTAKVVKVIDGDTIRVLWDERDFNFPVRFAELAAPEIDERGGLESQSWLESQILDKIVEIIPTKLRVERWGRLLANVLLHNSDMSAESINNGHAVSWKNRNQSEIPNFEEEMKQWF